MAWRVTLFVVTSRILAEKGLRGISECEPPIRVLKLRVLWHSNLEAQARGQVSAIHPEPSLTLFEVASLSVASPEA